MILLITGMMASGKSTIAQAVAERLPRCVHLKGDVFRRMIVSGRADMEDSSNAEAYRQLSLRYRLSKATALEYANAGFNVIYQDVIIGPALNDVSTLFQGALAGIIVLCPRLDVIRQREQDRQKTGYGGFSIERLDQLFRTTPRLGYWLDNSDLTVEQTTDKVIEYLQAQDHDPA